MSKKVWMTVKIDLEKAYNNSNQDFIDVALIGIGVLVS